MKNPVRERNPFDHSRKGIVHAVWEVTLACDLKCSHCGSRAGRRRPNELNTQEALKVVDDLAELGCRELTLIGGEAYLRKDLSNLIRRAKDHGMYCGIQTGGRLFTQQKLEQYHGAGLDGVGISIDGMAAVHDQIRGVPGSWESAIGLLGRARELGLRTSVNTQIGPLTVNDLDLLFDVLANTHARQWQLQLTVAMGNAVDNPETLLQPFQIIPVYEHVLELYLRGLDHGLLVIPGNNLGYFGPQDRALRAVTGAAGHWQGCEAGDTTMGLEADGTIKGCPSLETETFGLGDIRIDGLTKTWQTAREVTEEKRGQSMSGFCKSCYYAPVCKAGCTWTSHSLLGYAGNNPYCYYRAQSLAGNGVREVITKVEEAPNQAFGIGRFEVSGICTTTGEPLNTEEYSVAQVDPRARPEGATDDLHDCFACGRYIYATETDCPHCGVQDPTQMRPDASKPIIQLLRQAQD